MNDSRITVISPDRRHLGEIERALQLSVPGNRVVTVEGQLQRLGSLTQKPAADILIADCAGDDIAELAPLEQINQLHPRTGIIVISKQQPPEFLIQAMRLGVREVLAWPLDTAALDAALERLSAKAALSAVTKGKVLAFVSCKGGSGATFLAANLACALAGHEGCRVALLDMNLQFGDALLFLSEQKAAQTLHDVVKGIHRLDPAFLKSSMVNAAPNLDVLAASEDPAHGMEIQPEHLEAVLLMARRHYDYVIVDLGRAVDAPTVRAFDHADLIYAVLQPAFPHVRGAKRLLDVFHTLEYPEDKVNLVLNRHEKGGEVDVKAIETALGKPIRRTLPNDYETVSASVNQGIPVTRLAPGSPVSRSLAEWSAQLQDKPSRESGNWITRVLKRA